MEVVTVFRDILSKIPKEQKNIWGEFWGNFDPFG